MKATETAHQRVAKILDVTRKEYGAIQDAIKEYKAKQAKAEADMKAAGDECNLNAYNKARAAKVEAEGALEMYEARAEKLEQEPLIDQDEYNKLCNDIQREFSEHIEQLRADLFVITGQLVDRVEAIHDELKEDNNTLHALQYDINRGYDLQYNGTTVASQSVKTVGTRAQYDVIAWADSIHKTMYEEMKREREASA